jgi:hypothetical protein
VKKDRKKEVARRVLEVEKEKKKKDKEAERAKEKARKDVLKASKKAEGSSKKSKDVDVAPSAGDQVSKLNPTTISRGISPCQGSSLASQGH